MKSAFAALLLAGATVASPALAQTTPPHSVVSIYRAAPGHQLAMLKWFAQRDEAAKAANVAPSVLYVHQDGASWDFVWISPDLTEAQDKAVEAASKRMGLTMGPKSGLELREHIAEHTDTMSVGPTSAAAWLKVIGE